MSPKAAAASAFLIQAILIIYISNILLLLPSSNSNKVFKYLPWTREYRISMDQTVNSKYELFLFCLATMYSGITFLGCAQLLTGNYALMLTQKFFLNVLKFCNHVIF